MSDDPVVDSMSATLRERPADLPPPEGLTADEAQDASIDVLLSELKQMRERVDDHEKRMRRLPRLFALATGLDPDLSLDLLEELLNKLVKETPGEGSPNKGADALASLLKGKAGGQATGGTALVTLALYLLARYLGVPVP